MAKKITGFKTKGMNQDLSVSAFNPEFAFENMNMRLSTNESNTTLSWVNEKGTAGIELVVSHWSKEGKENINGDYTDAVATTLPCDTENAYTTVADAEADGWSWTEGGVGVLLGTPIGTAVLNHQLVLFTTGNTVAQDNTVYPDHIYIIKYAEPTSTQMIAKEYYKGNLSFQEDAPLETIVSYENELVQKVYWVDDINQPRLMNICREPREGIDTQFDFVPELQLNEKITIKKSIDSKGVFPAGVIQYAFTYYNRYMQESNIFYVSPLFYISHASRAGSPEDTSIANAFTIRVENPDTNFDFIRVYSILRTSLNSTPIVKRVQDISLSTPTTEAITTPSSSSNNDSSSTQTSSESNEESTQSIDSEITSVNIDTTTGITYVTYTDLGTSGDSVDPTELLYKENNTITCLTLDSKDSTLFLGSLKKNTDKNFLNIKKLVGKEATDNTKKIKVYNTKGVTEQPIRRYITNTSKVSELEGAQLSAGVAYDDVETGEINEVGHIGVSCAGFKSSNYYRLGVQFQDRRGKWSDPVYLDDVRQRIKFIENANLGRATFFGEIPEAAIDVLIDAGYDRARAVCVFPEYNSRVVMCQGIANATLFTSHNRDKETLYSQSSWFYRPFQVDRTLDNCYGTDVSRETLGTATPTNCWDVVNDDWNYPYVLTNLKKDECIDTPLPGVTPSDSKLWRSDWNPYSSQEYPSGGSDMGLWFKSTEVQGIFKNSNKFQIDWLNVTFDSPDVFFDAQLLTSDFMNLKAYMIGRAVFSKTYSAINIQCETPPIVPYTQLADKSDTFQSKGSNGIIAGAWYRDSGVNNNYQDWNTGTNNLGNTGDWMVYPWHKHGSLNNDIVRPSNEGVQTAKLKKKVMSNYRVADSSYFDVKDTTETIDSSNITIDKPAGTDLGINTSIGVWKSNELSIIKYSSKVYKGNIDTILPWDEVTPLYLSTSLTTVPSAWYEKPVSADSQQSGYTANINNILNNSIGIAAYWWYRCESWFSDYSWWNDDRNVLKDKLANITNNLLTLKGKVVNGHQIIDDLVYAKDSYYDILQKIHDAIPSGGGLVFLKDSTVWEWLGDWENYISENTSKWRYVVGNADLIASRSNWHIVEIGKVRNLETNTSSVPSWSEGSTFNENITRKQDNTRIQYKSTPHLVFGVEDKGATSGNPNYGKVTWGVDEAKADNNIINPWLPIVELQRTVGDGSELFGGTSEDALKTNNWIPCGEPIKLVKGKINYFYYLYGDSYYQRYDHMKTYPFTPEDVNQMVEIGSFMLESYINLDGRYDRNRGQINNLNMSPTNFNLLNHVYSQIDNFFTYKIQEDDYYKNQNFPNLITWSKTKASGDETDMWTNITLANTLELDGDKGKINKLIRFNNNLLAFQDTGISQILYNENVQISSTQGVPIEIANSGKVQGKRYLSDTVGCSNKYSMVSTPTGIYFMDNTDKSVYLFNGQLQNLSQTRGFNTWCKQHIPSSSNKWTPTNFDSNFVTYYDKLNQDILFIGESRALAYSEKLGSFTSFYNYENTPYFCNLDDTGLWLRVQDKTTQLWKHQAGEYGKFFNTKKPYWTILIGNPEPQTDKIFTNLEFRATIDTDGELVNDKFTPLLPFDSLEVWDEYQHGYASLNNLTKHAAYTHGNESSSLKRKFRMWRCDIPRNNCVLDNDREEQGTYNYSTDAELNVSRHIRKPMDRMRNPWLYLKLTKRPNENNGYRTELHDFVMTYFN